jgi:hypothetical protein
MDHENWIKWFILWFVRFCEAMSEIIEYEKIWESFSPGRFTTYFCGFTLFLLLSLSFLIIVRLFPLDFDLMLIHCDICNDRKCDMLGGGGDIILCKDIILYTIVPFRTHRCGFLYFTSQFKVMVSIVWISFPSSGWPLLSPEFHLPIPIWWSWVVSCLERKIAWH